MLIDTDNCSFHESKPNAIQSGLSLPQKVIDSAPVAVFVDVDSAEIIYLDLLRIMVGL